MMLPLVRRRTSLLLVKRAVLLFGVSRDQQYNLHSCIFFLAGLGKNLMHTRTISIITIDFWHPLEARVNNGRNGREISLCPSCIERLLFTLSIGSAAEGFGRLEWIGSGWFRFV